MSTSPDIFLSYSREDAATARRFADGLEAQGFAVWWDAALSTGESYDQVTEKALKEAKAVVVLWSKKSVDSRWVRAEATMADRNKTLAPVMIERCQRPIMFELTHTAELTHWKGDSNDKAWQSFVADVRKFVAKSAPDRAAVPADSRPHTPAAAIPWYRNGQGRIALIALPVLVAATVLYVFLRTPSRVAQPTVATTVPASSAASATVAPQAAPTGTSLAVLPFVNMSSDPEQEYFSDGLSEELLNQLAQLKDLKVAGRTSSFSFKGKNEDLRVIGETLGVNHLLEGSVRKAGMQLRITVQLINAVDGTHLWSHSYDRKLSDVFSVQEEIAKDVAKALSITLGVGSQVSAAAGGTSNVAAYDKYLRARGLFHQIGPAELLRAIAIFREALALDPNFARAWAGLYEASSYTLTLIPERSAEARREMAEASAHVFALAPDAWWAQTMRAEQKMNQHRWAEAEAANRVAMDSAPASEVDAAFAYGLFLLYSGRVREATEYIKRVGQLDHLSLVVSTFLQVSLDSTGLPAEAQAELERSKDIPGDHAYGEWMAVMRLWSQPNADMNAVNAQFRHFVDHEGVPLAVDHELLDKLGDKTAALAAIRRAVEDPANQDATRLAVISRYADRFGDKDLALAALRRVADLNSGTWYYLLWWPFNTHLRADPRFKQIIRDLKLDDYWRKSGKWGDFCHPVGQDDFECQ